MKKQGKDIFPLWISESPCFFVYFPFLSDLMG
nr:MAG TPA: hypothetical protein [Caudoviricetes sp.]